MQRESGLARAQGLRCLSRRFAPGFLAKTCAQRFFQRQFEGTPTQVDRAYKFEQHPAPRPHQALKVGNVYAMDGQACDHILDIDVAIRPPFVGNIESVTGRRACAWLTYG